MQRFLFHPECIHPRDKFLLKKDKRQILVYVAGDRYLSLSNSAEHDDKVIKAHRSDKPEAQPKIIPLPLFCGKMNAPLAVKCSLIQRCLLLGQKKKKTKLKIGVCIAESHRSYLIHFEIIFETEMGFTSC